MKLRTLAIGLVSLSVVACSKAPDKSPANPTQPSAGSTSGTGTPKAQGDHDHGPGGHTHESVSIGESQSGPFMVKAARDEGALKAGAELHLDIEASGATFTSIRAWVGTPDAKGSRKALGEVEHADRPVHRHFHVEIPNPIPAGSRLHVEVDGADGKTHTASFDLKL
jgi:hypothetical protein